MPNVVAILRYGSVATAVVTLSYFMAATGEVAAVVVPAIFTSLAMVLWVLDFVLDEILVDLEVQKVKVAVLSAVIDNMQQSHDLSPEEVDKMCESIREGCREALKEELPPPQ